MAQKSITALISGSVLLAATASAAASESGYWRGGLQGHHHSHSARSGPAIGYTTPAVRLRGVGTFSRSVWVNGVSHAAESPPLAPRAKVIVVDDRYLARSGACSYEAGICVVRAAY